MEDYDDEYDAAPPELLCCPISRELMLNCVKSPCGHSFSEEAILNWLQSSNTCPIDRRKLKSTSLKPNIDIQKLARSWAQDHLIGTQLKRTPKKRDSDIEREAESIFEHDVTEALMNNPPTPPLTDDDDALPWQNDNDVPRGTRFFTGLLVAEGRIGYVVLNFVMFLVALVLQALQGKLSHMLLSPRFQAWCHTIDGLCGFDLLAGRITLALTLFHLLLAIALFTVKAGDNSPRRQRLNNRLWLLKVFWIVILVVCCMIVPRQFFSIFAWIEVIVGGVVAPIWYLVMLLVFCSWASDVVTDHYYDGYWWRSAAFFLRALTGLLYLSTLTMICLMFLFFGDFGLCLANTIYISLDMLACLVVSACTKIPVLGSKVGVLHGSVISFVATFLLLVSFSTQPTEQCNPFGSSLHETFSMAAFAWGLISLVFIHPVLARLFPAPRRPYLLFARERRFAEQGSYWLSLFHIVFVICCLQLGSSLLSAFQANSTLAVEALTMEITTLAGTLLFFTCTLCGFGACCILACFDS